MTRRKLTVRRKAYRRKAYTRKDGVRVKATRVPATTFKIRDIGARGRGKKVIPKIRKGLLGKYGYSTKLSLRQRRTALRKADKRYGTKRLFRMLQAQVVLRKRTQPTARRVFVADRNWVERVLLSRKEALQMTAKPRKKWMGMSPQARARAMPSRRRLRRMT